MRGTVPKAVTFPFGEIRVILSPTAIPRRSARRDPTTTASSALEVGQGAGLDIAGDDGAPGEVGWADAAHHGAARHAARRRHDLALDERADPDDAGDLADLPGKGVEVAQGFAGAVDAEVSVEAENAGQELLAKAVHHRHDDDQRRHAKGDARAARTRR